MSDGGLPGKQKSHKLQLETKSNVVIYQKNLFDRNSVCKTVINICGDLSMSLIIFQSLIMGERYIFDRVEFNFGSNHENNFKIKD